MDDKEEVENAENMEGKVSGSEGDLWRRYMNLFVEKEEQLEAKDRLHLRLAADLPNLPNVESEDEFPVEGYPINIFNQGDKTKLPNRLKPEDKVEVWNRMRDNPPVDMSCFIPEQVAVVSKTDSGRWPGVYPCRKPDSHSDSSKRRRKFGEPCPEFEPEDTVLGEPKDDFANHIELWHARIPAKCPSVKSNPPMVDRSSGLNHSLVSGDYVLTETVSKKKGNRVYANICLRGLVGMHLPELDGLRERKKTWKWCFYQAIVALLVKTQLRYKHTWSGNIDYIYERGWNLFQHIGNINVKHVGKQKFDDVGVYNYAYDVEVELIQEIKDIPRITNVTWDYVESNHRRTIEVERKDFVKLQSKIGVEKTNDGQTAPVHKSTKEIERWFDKLPFQYQNCIFKTTRYCLAFWKEGPFWYLHNPYRCNDFGFWDDTGYACIVKFCSRNALKRHLMILLLRAYVYELPRPQLQNSEKIVKESDVTDEKEEETINDVFDIQIFQLIYNKCELRNSKLLERQMPKPMMRPVGDKRINICPYDPLDSVDWCAENEEIDNVESPGWLKRFKVTWTQCQSSNKRIVRGSIVTEKLRWHQFYVEEPNKLFSLWGEIHPTQSLFPVEHRGKQTYACYLICAGMTRITAPEYWSPKTLDAVVMCGDKYYTISTVEAELKAKRPEYSDIKNWDRYLARNFKIGETMFQGTLLPGIRGRLYLKSAHSLWGTLQNMFLKHPFGIITCESTCVGVFKFCGAYYMCDVHSTGPPLFQYGGGVVYLIRTTCFTKFMNVLTLTIASTECSEFEVNPIQLYNAVDVGPTTCLTRIEKTNRSHKLHKKLGNVSCEHELHDRKSCIKNSRSKARNQKNAIGKAPCKGQESPCEAAGYAKP